MAFVVFVVVFARPGRSPAPARPLAAARETGGMTIRWSIAGSCEDRRLLAGRVDLSTGGRNGGLAGPRGFAKSGPAIHASSRAERWQSGRSRRTRNAEYGQPYRGFESLPLRQFLSLEFSPLADRPQKIPNVCGVPKKTSALSDRAETLNFVLTPPISPNLWTAGFQYGLCKPLI